MTISLSLFVWYEWLGGKEYINYQEVIVLKENVNRGQIISAANMSRILVGKDAIIDDGITSENEVIGLVAKHFIPGKEQLHSNFFESANVHLEEGQYVAQIPAEWTLAMPNSMRRGDKIVIYSVNYDKELVQSLQGSQVSSKSTDTKKSNEKEIDENNSEQDNSNDSKDSKADDKALEETIEDINSMDTQNELNKVLEVNVAYVKDSANREVVSIGELDRLDGSSSIHAVEIITTTEEFSKIEEQINKGAKLILMYKESEVNKDEVSLSK